MKSLKVNNNNNIYINVITYPDNDRLCIISFKDEHCKEFYNDITYNLPNRIIKNFDESFINSIHRKSGLENELIKQGIIKKVIKSVNYNGQKYDLVKFNIDKLKEYDPIGVEDFINTINEPNIHKPSI